MEPISPDTIAAPSKNIVARLVEGELLIIPLVSGIADVDDVLYTLNPTGQAIWQLLDGKRSIRQVATALAAEFEAPISEIEEDVAGLVDALLDRGFLIEVT